MDENLICIIDLAKPNETTMVKYTIMYTPKEGEDTILASGEAGVASIEM